MCEHSWIDDAFQLPQGGIEEGENPEDAILRELYEEIGTKSFKIIKKMDRKLRYLFPVDLRKKYQKDGQIQTYFLIQFLGEDKEIRFDNQPKPEFKSFEWVGVDEPVKRVIYFKKLVYNEAINYFREEIENLKI